MKKVISLVTVVGVLLVGSAWAQGPGPGPQGAPCRAGAGPRMGLGRVPDRGDREWAGGRGGLGGGLMFMIRHPALAEKAGLTKEEIQKLRDLAFKHRKEMIAFRAEAEKARLEWEAAEAAEQPDLAAVESAIDRVYAIEAQIEKARYRHHQAVRAVISEERLQDLWKSARALREDRWEQRRDKRGFRPLGKERGDDRKRWHRFGKPSAGMDGPKVPPPSDDDEDEGERRRVRSLTKQGMLKR